MLEHTLHGPYVSQLVDDKLQINAPSVTNDWALREAHIITVDHKKQNMMYLRCDEANDYDNAIIKQHKRRRCPLIMLNRLLPDGIMLHTMTSVARPAQAKISLHLNTNN